MITDYSNQYLSFMSQKNSFGIIPYGLFSKQDPGGNRKVGNYWYRYFMQPELSWWVGINANIASAGVGLMKAAEILNDLKLKQMAQNNWIFWIIGVNPYNSSTLMDLVITTLIIIPEASSEFDPPTPVLPGAVMGYWVGGMTVDRPFKGEGHYNISE